MSSTTTRPPRAPGALVADAVAELEDVTARLAHPAAEGAFAEVPVAAMSGLTETMHRALDVDADHLASGLGGELLIPGREQPVLLPSESVRRILCDADLHPVITTRPGGCMAHAAYGA